VQEADHAGQPGSRRLVDEREAALPRAGQLGGDVGCLEADVVQTFAALLEDLGPPPAFVDRLELFDLAPADGEQGGLHALVRDRGLGRDLEAQAVPPERQSVLEAADDQADVVHARQHQSPYAARRSGSLAASILASVTIT
jgi:hypothetical protein